MIEFHRHTDCRVEPLDKTIF